MFRSGSSSVALVLLALAGAAPLAAQSRAEPETSRTLVFGTPIRLLYVWDSTLPGDAAGTRSLLQFARARRYDMLALEASPLGYGEPGTFERYRRFTSHAHAAGLRVLALSGFPWFTVSAGAAVPDQPTAHEEGWQLYANLAGSGLFDGLLDDSNPVETEYVHSDGSRGNHFWDDPVRAAQEYLDWLHGLESVAGVLPRVQSVPMWFDSHPALSALFLDGETSPHPLSWYVARSVDVVNVLAYRDRAAEIWDGAVDELALGPVLIGVETVDLGPALDHVTFFEEGYRFLERELLAVWERARLVPAFQGFSVHHYGSLRDMERIELRRGRTR